MNGIQKGVPKTASWTIASFVLALLALGIGKGLGEFGTNAVWSNFRSDSNQGALLDVSNRINATLPIQLDADTRLDRTFVGDQLITYEYTLTRYSVEELNIPYIRQTFRQRLIELYCEGDMAQFAKTGVSVTYVYLGMLGKEAVKIDFQPSDCSR